MEILQNIVLYLFQYYVDVDSLCTITFGNLNFSFIILPQSNVSMSMEDHGGMLRTEIIARQHDRIIPTAFHRHFCTHTAHFP